MKQIKIIATLLILTSSIFIIHGVPKHQIDTINEPAFRFELKSSTIGEEK